jgi:hypothetical protein
LSICRSRILLISCILWGEPLVPAWALEEDDLILGIRKTRLSWSF